MLNLSTRCADAGDLVALQDALRSFGRRVNGRKTLAYALQSGFRYDVRSASFNGQWWRGDSTTWACRRKARSLQLQREPCVRSVGRPLPTPGASEAVHSELSRGCVRNLDRFVPALETSLETLRLARPSTWPCTRCSLQPVSLLRQGLRS